MDHQEQKLRAFVEQWLADNPDRVTERRVDALVLEDWKRAAIRHILQFHPTDAEREIERFATQVED
ncbi:MULTISPECIES: hypothetical protein [Hymenobacter]|uniref:Uncharacterized protein n=1 Tax=Hymenobacter jejuensis TaxID=2502781 RepID=A0A5B7ZX29_9BACT|nr:MULTISPECIES: hypothetical protein [Hymenobacter]MBC6988077.1 hypothetical protein [Hymenobacter sp. BT491]QDA59548.1 hypothetical protein FHG12_05250 [Hymenobacter jejuensis]